jgi:hypothetical protein
VNGTPADVPPGVLTVTLLRVREALFRTAKLALTVVEFTTVTPLTVTPGPVTATEVPVEVKLVPASVTGMLVMPLARRVAVARVIAASAGGGGLVTVNVTAPEVPPRVVTVTLRPPSPAAGPMLKVALTVVGLVTVKPATVTPVPDTLTPVVPVRLVPVRVTATLVLPRVPVLGLIEVSVGAGGLVTVNITLPVVTPDVVTLMFLFPNVVPGAIVKVALTVVSFTTVIPLTAMLLVPVFTVVVPVKPLPERVTATVAPRAPELGLIPVSVGRCTVNATELVVPNGPVTETFLTPVVALVEMVKVAVIVVEFTTLKLLTVIALPIPVNPVSPVRFVPVRVTLTVVPRNPWIGLIEVSVGPCTVNETLLLVPPGVVTLTFLVVNPAVAEIVKFAVIVLEFTTVKLGTVTPKPDTVTAVVPSRLVPVRVTATVVPRVPALGLIDVNVGGGVLPWNSTAPMSNLLDTAGSGLGLPKKSVLGARIPAADATGT